MIRTWKIAMHIFMRYHLLAPFTYLRQFSYHSRPSKDFLCPQGRSSIPHLLQSVLIQEYACRVFVWPLKYWTTDSPELLAAVVTWNVRHCCLLQWNLIWVKDKCLLSSFMALIVILILWFMNLLIPRYDVSAVQAGGVVELSIIKMDVRSQPPSNVK